MNELFKRTLMVCTAVSVFGGGAFIGDSVLSSYIKSKQVAAAVATVNEEGEVVKPTPLAAVDVPKPKASLSFSFGK
jgi:hypothetical protein